MSLSFAASQGPVKFGDTKEGTFALRLAPELDAPTGTMVNSEGGEGEAQIWGKRANWVDVDGVIDGQSLGVAIFDQPEKLSSSHLLARSRLWIVRCESLWPARLLLTILTRTAVIRFPWAGSIQFTISCIYSRRQLQAGACRGEIH